MVSLCLLTHAATLPAGAGSLPGIGVDEIHRGQKGYGLSVFAGTEPQRFEVEVVGVVRNSNPASSFILARLSGEPEGVDLTETGVIAGMSGSPVFLDGRLAGAVAFSWSFTNGALAGITPIGEMRRLTTLPRPPGAPAAAGPPVPLAGLLARELPEDLLERRLRLLAPATAAGNPLSVGWAAAGFGEQSRRRLERQLGPLAPMGEASGDGAGGGGGDGEPELVLGGAVAAVLVDGDLKLAATGTVTDLDGDSVLAFGHPFLALGPIRVPMATAEIVTVVSNRATSFKIANLGTRVGSFEQDRLTGIQGRLGVEAPMVPLKLRIGGAGESVTTEFAMEVASLPVLTPTLLAVATLGALDVARYSAGDQGLDLEVRFRLDGGHGELAVVQSFDGTTAVRDAVSYLIAVSAYLLQNELEQVELEAVEVALAQADEPRTLSLVGAHAERSVLRPGQRVRLNLDLLPYRGTPFRRSVEVEIPEDVPDGPYYLFVGDGASIDAARLAVEPVEPITLPQALRLLRSFHTRRQLGVLGIFAGGGLAVAGEVLPRLPGSVASIWGAAPSGSAVPLRQVVAQELFEPLDNPMDGLVRIDLQVRRREPLVPGGDAGGGAGDLAIPGGGTAAPSEPARQGTEKESP